MLSCHSSSYYNPFSFLLFFVFCSAGMYLRHQHSLLCNTNGQQFVIIILYFLLFAVLTNKQHAGFISRIIMFKTRAYSIQFVIIDTNYWWLSAGEPLSVAYSLTGFFSRFFVRVCVAYIAKIQYDKMDDRKM